jgi:hypothetical protein
LVERKKKLTQRKSKKIIKKLRWVISNQEASLLTTNKLIGLMWAGVEDNWCIVRSLATVPHERALEKENSHTQGII